MRKRVDQRAFIVHAKRRVTCTSSFIGETDAKEGGARFLLCRDFIRVRDASSKVSSLV